MHSEVSLHEKLTASSIRPPRWDQFRGRAVRRGCGRGPRSLASPLGLAVGIETCRWGEERKGEEDVRTSSNLFTVSRLGHGGLHRLKTRSCSSAFHLARITGRLPELDTQRLTKSQMAACDAAMIILFTLSSDKGDVVHNTRWAHCTVVKIQIHCFFFLLLPLELLRWAERILYSQADAFVWDTYCVRHGYTFFFLSQPKRGKGRGDLSSSSSALKEKLEERRREMILYLLFVLRPTFNVQVDLSQKYLRRIWKSTLKGQCFFFTFKVLFPYLAIRIILRWPLLQCWE